MTVPSFLFVVGAGRSGTTLLQAMLDAHPRLAVALEARFVGKLAPRHRRYERRDGFDVDAFVRDLWRIEGFRRWQFGAGETRALLQDASPDSFADAVRVLFRSYAHAAGKEMYGDKTPLYVRRMRLLASLFPEARFVHLIRDGRDVALSVLEMPFGPRTVVRAAADWRRSVIAGRRTGGRLGPTRYTEVRYEDLVADPEAALRWLCGAIALDYDPAMLQYPRRTGPLLAQRRIAEHHGRIASPPTAGVRDWRVQMPEADQRRFEAIAGHLVDELGYERRHRRLPVRDVTLAWSAVAGGAHTDVLARLAGRVARRTTRA